MNKQRWMLGLIVGALLGVVCIVGAQVRSGFSQSPDYLLGFWYNRVIMGAMIGLLPVCASLRRSLVRGALVGLAVSFAFYVSTGFADVIGFLVGAVYGIILEWVLTRFTPSV